MDRRVSMRRPRERTADGPTGRGPRRKQEVDYWLDAGLYDEARAPGPSTMRPARMSTVKVRQGELAAMRSTYELVVFPVLKESPDFVGASLLVNSESSTITAVSTWASEGGFAATAATPAYVAAMDQLKAHFDDEELPTSMDVAQYDLRGD